MNGGTEEHSNAVPMKFYGSMVVGAVTKHYSPDNRQPTNGNLMSSHSAVYDHESIRLAQQSLRLLKSRHPELKGKKEYLEGDELNRFASDSLFQPARPLQYDQTPVGSTKKGKRQVYFNPIYFYKGSSQQTHERNRFETEALPPLYECPCKCGKVMTKLQLQGHLHSCEMLLKFANREENVQTPATQSKDPLMELLNSIPRLNRKRDSSEQPKAFRIARVLGVPLQNHIDQPTTERNKQNKPNTRTTNRGNIKCPTCQRIFSIAVGTRHMQFCSYLKKAASSPPQR